MAEVIGKVIEVQLKIAYTKIDGSKKEAVKPKTVRIKEEEARKIGALIFNQDTFKKILTDTYTTDVTDGLSQTKTIEADEKSRLDGTETGKNTLVVIYSEPHEGVEVLAECAHGGHPKTWELQ